MKGLLRFALALGAIVGGGAWAAKRFFGTSDAGGGQASSGADAGAPPPPRREGLDPTLLEILACPEDKAPVIYQREGDAERLTCTRCGKRYPVRDGIPVMLIDEAEVGPLPGEPEIAAARALAREGKPALVGAAAPSVVSGEAAAAPPASDAAGAAGPAPTA